MDGNQTQNAAGKRPLRWGLIVTLAVLAAAVIAGGAFTYGTVLSPSADRSAQDARRHLEQDLAISWDLEGVEFEEIDPDEYLSTLAKAYGEADDWDEMLSELQNDPVVGEEIFYFRSTWPSQEEAGMTPGHLAPDIPYIVFRVQETGEWGVTIAPRLPARYEPSPFENEQ